jgi:hypothetical protein
MRYTYESTTGLRVTVEARDDRAARRLAMVAVHGPEPGRIGSVVVREWVGYGLNLVGVEK